MLRPSLIVATMLCLAYALATTPVLAGTGVVVSPTATPEPTRTPLPPGVTPVTIRVIHDLDKDGEAQAAEPGIGGVSVYGGCGDALISLPATDANGTIETYLNPFQGRVHECYRLERPFGWLPTTSLFVTVDEAATDAVDVVFLLHDLGRDVMEISGEVIVAGLPAKDPRITLAPPFDGCSELHIDFSNAAQTQVVLFVVSPAVRGGCAGAGSEVSVLVDGLFATLMPVQPGQRVPEPLAVAGDSLRLYATDIDAARIDGTDCGVVAPVQGFVPPDFVRVFVLPAEVRAGCGVPSKLVRFFRDGAPLDPVIGWQAGALDAAPEFVPAAEATPTPRRLVPPETGAGTPADTGTRFAWLTVAIAATGVALVAGAVVIGGSSHKR